MKMTKNNKYGEVEISSGGIIICILIFVIFCSVIAWKFDKNTNNVTTTIDITYQDNSKETLHYNKDLFIELKEGDLSVDNNVIRSSVKSYKEYQKQK